MNSHRCWTKVFPGRRSFQVAGEYCPAKWDAFVRRAFDAGGRSCPAKRGTPEAATGMEIPRNFQYPDLNDREQFLEDCQELFDAGSHGKSRSGSDPAELSASSSNFAVSIFRKLIIDANDDEVQDIVTGEIVKGVHLMRALAAKGLIETMKALALREITEDQARADLDAA